MSSCYVETNFPDILCNKPIGNKYHQYKTFSALIKKANRKLSISTDKYYITGWNQQRAALTFCCLEANCCHKLQVCFFTSATHSGMLQLCNRTLYCGCNKGLCLVVWENSTANPDSSEREATLTVSNAQQEGCLVQTRPTLNSLLLKCYPLLMFHIL